jgi:hypothetical protein
MGQMRTYKDRSAVGLRPRGICARGTAPAHPPGTPPPSDIVDGYACCALSRRVFSPRAIECVRT